MIGTNPTAKEMLSSRDQASADTVGFFLLRHLKHFGFPAWDPVLEGFNGGSHLQNPAVDEDDLVSIINLIRTYPGLLGVQSNL